MPIDENGKRDIWKNRKDNLEKFFDKLNPDAPEYESAYLRLVPTYIIYNESMFWKWKKYY